MAPVPPHFPVPAAVVIGDFLIDTWTAGIGAGSPVYAVFFQITNHEDQRCIKHLENYHEYQLCVLAFVGSLHQGNAPSAVGNNHRYQHEIADGTRYEFVYEVVQLLVPGHGALRYAHVWAIHKYRPGKTTTGAYSKSAIAELTRKRFEGLGGGGSSKVK